MYILNFNGLHLKNSFLHSTVATLHSSRNASYSKVGTFSKIIEKIYNLHESKSVGNVHALKRNKKNIM